MPERQVLKSLMEIVPEKSRAMVSQAHSFALQKHDRQKRLSGEAYINHPLRIALNLARDGFDETIITAGLLHDTLEDTATTIAEIRETFGAEIAEIIDSVTKVSRIKLKNKDRLFDNEQYYLEQLDNYRKILFATAKDPRVIIVKLYDRLDNAETLKSLSKEKRKFYARETIQIFGGIAERIGMGNLKGRLEDSAFPYAYPEDYKKFQKQITDIYKDSNHFINGIMPQVHRIVEDKGIKVLNISGRSKFRYSLYKKLLRKGSLKTIYDVYALRLIVGSVEDCYMALGVIHSFYEPLPGQIDDYIAKPKDNGYQSLHTTIRNSDGKVFEVQIRTRDMHQIAEFGIAAHWNYKELRQKSSGGKKSALDWIAELGKVGENLSDKDFLAELRDRLFTDHIFVFTPKGEIIRLPKDSTSIDFAYRIHSDLGNRCVGAKINGRIMPLSTPLQTADSVEITTGKNPHPSEDWLKFVKTGFARQKIKNFLKIKQEDALAEIGSNRLQNALMRFKLNPFKKTDAEKNLTKSRLPYKSFTKALAALGSDNLSVIKLIKTIIPGFRPDEERKKALTQKASDGFASPILKNIPHEIAKCCRPKASDAAIGYLGTSPVIKIHKINCKRIKDADKRRLIPLDL